LDLPVSDLPVFDLPVLDLPVLDLPALDLPVFGFASLVEIKKKTVRQRFCLFDIAGFAQVSRANDHIMQPRADSLQNTITCNNAVRCL
jgi:hypothetical protein